VGGVGLNLVNANNVILADMWWNPSLEDQAVDRTHRLGQEREVNIFKLLVSDSIEERILELQDRKRRMRDKVIDGKADEEGSGMTTNQLINLLI